MSLRKTFRSDVSLVLAVHEAAVFKSWIPVSSGSAGS